MPVDSPIDLNARRSFRIGEFASLTVTILIAATAALPLVVVGSGAGVEDWDYFIHHDRAIRISLFEYGEFPWWNPWNCSGTPLAANPQVGLFAPIRVALFLLDSPVGLRWTAFIHVLIAVGASFRLARTLGLNRLGASLAGVVFACNGSVCAYLWAGHLGVVTYAFLPFVVDGLLRLAESPRHAVYVGLAASAAALTSLHYVTFYIALTIIVWSIGLLIKPIYFLRSPSTSADRTKRTTLVFRLALIASIVVAVAGARLAWSILLLRDHPRGNAMIVETDLGFARFIESITSIDRRFADENPALDCNSLGPHESAAFVGWTCLALLIGSIVLLGFRVEHALVIVAALCWIGNRQWWQPMNWVESIPFASFVRVPTRIRVVAMLPFALVVGMGADRLRSMPRLGRLAETAYLLAVAELIFNAWFTLSATFAGPSIEALDSEAFLSAEGVAQVRSVRGDAAADRLLTRCERLRLTAGRSESIEGDDGRLAIDEAPTQFHIQEPKRGTQSRLDYFLRRRTGVVWGYEPVVAADQKNLKQEGLRRINHPESSRYLGEFGCIDESGERLSEKESFDRGLVLLKRWSPQQIHLIGRPGLVCWLNQNRSNCWTLNGTRLFPETKSLDREKSVEFIIPENGSATLVVAPQNSRLGWICPLVGVPCSLVFLILSGGRRSRR